MKKNPSTVEELVMYFHSQGSSSEIVFITSNDEARIPLQIDVLNSDVFDIDKPFPSDILCPTMTAYGLTFRFVDVSNLDKLRDRIRHIYFYKELEKGVRQQFIDRISELDLKHSVSMNNNPFTLIYGEKSSFIPNLDLDKMTIIESYESTDDLYNKALVSLNGR